ncbi:MAG: class I SAM-dependent methyltransferase [Hyphomicrobiales bacterium]|nr:MAG: class I SAM-dependent methyltransferase [Hyphomicrobiales bacterium]
MSISSTIMHKLYGTNIWDGFSPQFTEDQVQGWNGDHPSLSRLASLQGPKIIVDVGVWKGQSTITMANALKNNGIDGVIIAVDTFLGSPEHWSGGGLFQRIHGLPNLYDIFMSNVHRAGVTDFIIPMAQTSSTAAKIIKQLGIRPTIVHVDAAHEYREAMQDLEDYWELLEDGGYLIGDDYHVTWPGIVQAAGEFSAKVCRPLTVEIPKFIIHKS